MRESPELPLQQFIVAPGVVQGQFAYLMHAGSPLHVAWVQDVKTPLHVTPW